VGVGVDACQNEDEHDAGQGRAVLVRWMMLRRQCDQCGDIAMPRNTVFVPEVRSTVPVGLGAPVSMNTTKRSGVAFVSAVLALNVTFPPVSMPASPRNAAGEVPELTALNVVVSDQLVPLKVHFWMPPPLATARSSAM